MRMLTFICALCAAITAFADTAAPRRMRPRGMAKASGGIVEKAYKGKVVRVVNTIANEQGLFDEIVLKIRRSAQLPIESVRGDLPKDATPMTYARKLTKADDNVGSTVLLVDDAALPIILVSPDEKWAILNVATMKSDSEKYAARLSKALWGAIARALGAGSTGDVGCVLVPFSDLRTLDAIAATEPSPIAHNALIDVAKMSGVNMIYFATYRTACQQGWAPQPVNDVQRKIWNEIHAIPDKPLTIEFDPKKDK